MAKLDLSTKRVQIDKANVVMVTAIASVAFVTIFSLVSVKALWSQRVYQSKVIAARQKANDQLTDNIKAADSLVSSYRQFVASPENVIGGNASGTGERDGDNARIVLDALPSKYDFPALATSLEKILTDRNYKIDTLVGVDDELTQALNVDTPTPAAVEMPFEIGVTSDFVGTQKLIGVFEHSIRPFRISELLFNASQANQVSINIKAKTYYQPEKTLTFKSEVIK